MKRALACGMILGLFWLAGLAVPHALGRPAAGAVAAIADQAVAGDGSLREALSALRARHRLPALAGATACADGAIDHGVVGARRVGATEAVERGDLFHVGSVTKSMTATMLASLVEEGRLGWESTVEQLAPEWVADLHPTYRSVTLRQLLSHSAGLADPWTAEQWASLPHDAETPGSEQRRRMALEVMSRPPIGPPGEVWQYANVGYGIAVALAERLTGREWEDLMRERLFGPLGLASAGFGWPVTQGRLHQPWGHVVEGAPGEGIIDGLRAWGPEHPHRIPTVIAPAGDVHMSVADLARYALLHLRGARGESTAILSPSTFAELHQPILEGYALGWNVVGEGTARMPGVRQLQHLGSGGTFTSVVALFPELGLAGVAVHNGGSNTAAVADAMYTLVARARAEPRACAEPAVAPSAR